MEREEEKIIENAKKLILTSEEKFAIKQQVLSHMDKNPLGRKVWSTETIFGFLNLKSVYLVPLSIILIIGGGLGYIANESLPGSMLYPVKINVNENMESLVAVSPESQAEVDLKQVGTRLYEAETLSVKGELTDVKSQTIVSNLSKNVASLDANIEKVEKKGDTKTAKTVAQNFENKIEEHLGTFINLFSSKKNTQITAEIASDASLEGGERNVEAANQVMFASNLAPEASTTTEYKMAEVKKHRTLEDCWATVDSDVYDFTIWLEEHEKDPSKFKKVCGTNATRTIKNLYKENYTEQFIEFKIGVIVK